jgi:hypothetical protein
LQPDWNTPAGQALDSLSKAIRLKGLSLKRPILVFGSAPLQIYLDPAFLSADMDVALTDQREEIQRLVDEIGLHKSRLPQTVFLGRLYGMSTVELAVKKVRKLSAPQARQLLGWLDGRQANGTAAKRRHQPWWRRGTARQRREKLKAWHDSVCGTTDWEPPRVYCGNSRSWRLMSPRKCDERSPG